jgi:hypothetical protein
MEGRRLANRFAYIPPQCYTRTRDVEKYRFPGTGRADHVAFRGTSNGTTSMHYVGRARRLEREGQMPILPGLFPVGTEFLHSATFSRAYRRARRLESLRYFAPPGELTKTST